MNLLSRQFIVALRGVKLSVTERARMKDKLMSHIVLTPLLVRSTRAHMVTSRKSWKRKAFRRTLPFTLIVALLLGASVSYAAERTVPGDKLYPIKIHVNERARRALAVTDIAQAENEANFVVRRLNEAVILAKESKLDDTKKSELKKQFTEHKNNFTEKVERVREKNTKDAEKMTKDFKGLIKERRGGLQALDLHDDDEDDNIHASTTSVSGATSTSIRRGDDGRDGRREELRRVRDDKKNDRGRDHDDDSDEDDDTPRKGTTLPASATPRLALTPTSGASSTTTTSYTLSDVTTHNSAQSCYTTIAGKVYDITSYIDIHPGGRNQILSVCGKDGSSLFANQHSGQMKPERMLASFKIGILR